MVFINPRKPLALFLFFFFSHAQAKEILAITCKMDVVVYLGNVSDYGKTSLQSALSTEDLEAVLFSWLSYKH